MAANIPYTGNYTFSDNGVIIPDTADIKETVQSEYQSALGQDLSLEDATPQGRLIDTETTARQSTINFNATIANALINISLASGTALDAWAANFDIYRNSATASRVPVTVTGVPDTVIPANSEASTSDGVIWLAESEIIIDDTGSSSGIFICSKTGAVELGTGQLTNIVASSTTGVNGWETITNTAPATVGSTLESDASLKARLLASIFSGSALFGNYASACYAVENVKDVYAYDNPNDYELVLDNITIPPHSIYVCVNGGNSEDVAYALYEVKSAGCGWCGNTTVTVTDKTYNSTSSVTFQTAEQVPFKITVNATSNNNSSANLGELITNTVVEYFNNAYQSESIPKIGIRSLISPFVIGSVINSKISNIQTLQVEIGLMTPKPHAVATIKKASVTSGTEWASVNSQTFASKAEANGTYNFIYNGSSWLLNSDEAELSDYGISITGNPVKNDVITIVFADGELSQYPINIFASETPAITAENITVSINE
jgi:hypothetical protein